MSIFLIVLIALWVYPILAYFASRTRIAKRISLFSLSSATIILIAALLGISTTSDKLDCFLIFLLYFSLLMILFYLYSFKNVIVRVATRLTLIVSLSIGYLLASLGTIILILMVSRFEPDRTIALKDYYAFKQYNLGVATESYRGTKISFVKRLPWLPGLEYETFSKTYNREYSPPQYPANNATTPTLYSDDFNVNYNAGSKTVILMDSLKKDTIHLR